MRARAVTWIGVLVAAGLAIPAAHADRGGFVIQSFETTLDVREDASLGVEERLEVVFHAPRHGIYRTIPVHYTDPIGWQYGLGFRLIEVVDDTGRRHTTRVRRRGDRVEIRIGDAEVTVRGRVVYVLRYAITGALRHFSEHDELYWNATGHQWRTPIEHAVARIRLPASLPQDSLEVAAFTGRFGERGTDATIRFPRPGEIVYEADHALGPLEGLTVVAAWPHGLVRFPGAWQRLLGFLGANFILLAPLGFAAWLYRSWRLHGRDPLAGRPIVVRYEPPEGLDAAEVGVLVDERADLRDLTAMIVDLAIHGYLRIEARQEDAFWGLRKRDVVTFHRTEKPADDLPPHAQRLLEALFAAGTTVDADDLKERFYKHIPDIRSRLYRRLAEQGCFRGNPERIRRRTAGFGFLWAVGVLFAGMMWSSSRGGVFPQAAFVPIAAAVLTFLVFLAFAPAMPARTRRGARVRQWALGFQEFVDRVEGDRLERDTSPRALFERLLPYAMALGVATRWARRFEDIYRDEPPHWYAGHWEAGRFPSTLHVQQSLSDAMDRTGKAMTASPRSSSSSGVGGGGFSGGGMGGGGGGSW